MKRKVYLYCLLPGGNRKEFVGLNRELRRRKVGAQYKELRAGGRLWRIPTTDLHKLPHDERGPYLGDNNSGYGIYKGDYSGNHIKGLGKPRTPWQSV